jgi:hypothetical protein
MDENPTTHRKDINYDAMDLDGKVFRFDCFSSSLTRVSVRTTSYIGEGAYESMTNDQ